MILGMQRHGCETTLEMDKLELERAGMSVREGVLKVNVWCWDGEKNAEVWTAKPLEVVWPRFASFGFETFKANGRTVMRAAKSEACPMCGSLGVTCFAR